MPIRFGTHKTRGLTLGSSSSPLVVRRGWVQANCIITTIPAVRVRRGLRALHVALDNVAWSVQRAVGRRGQGAPHHNALHGHAVRAIRHALPLGVMDGCVRHACG